jgi:hypothetical protein
MMGAESQFVLEMYDKNGDALAGNDVNATSDGGPTETDVVADSVPSLATSAVAAAAAAAATGAGGDISPTIANTSTAIKREMNDSPVPPGNVSSMAVATAATTQIGGGIVSVAAKTPVVKNEMDVSPATSGTNVSSTSMGDKAKSSTIMEGAGCSPVIAVKHEMDASPTITTATTSGNTSSTKAAARVIAIPIMPQIVEQVYCMRNVLLAGKSTNHIREGQTKTTFSIYDFGFSSETV